MEEQPSSHCEPKEKLSTVFKSQNKDVYRIPALFYVKEEKRLVAFAEKRYSADDAHSVALVMKTGAVTWDETSRAVTDIKWSESTDVITKAQLQGHRPMNPCPMYDKSSDMLYLFFITVEGTVSEGWQIANNNNKARLCYITTTDVGQTWSHVIDLTDSLEEIKSWATFAVGPGHGLQTEEGRLIVPVYAYKYCSSSGPCSKCECCALSLYSDDSGKNWKFGNMLQTTSVECQMAEIFNEDNKSLIYCNARTQGGLRVEAVSNNNGPHFCHLEPAKKLIETGRGCQGSVVSFPTQSEDSVKDSKPKWLLFTHPSDQSHRINLGVYLNKTPEDPHAWSKPWVINRGPSGYSDLVYLDYGWFVCVLECGERDITEQIASVVFNYNQVKQGIPE